MRQGQRAKQWSYENFDGNVIEEEAEAPYVDGERQGSWTDRSVTHGGRIGGSMWKGSYVEGRRDGDWVIEYRWDDGEVTRDYGPYMDGKKHGDWVERYAGGDMEKGPYVEGERQGR